MNKIKLLEYSLALFIVFLCFTPLHVFANSQPVANAGPDMTVNEGQTFTLDGSYSYDPDGPGDIVSYHWDFEDEGAVVNHLFKDDGVYTVTLTVTDRAGATSSDSATITVNNVAPTITPLTFTQLLTTPINNPINVSTNFTDAGKLDTHTAIFDWGDGSTSSGIINESEGSGSVAGIHGYTSPGQYTLSITLLDNQNASALTSTTFYLNTYLLAQGDTYLNYYAQNNNEGSSPILRVEGSANYRSLIKFDQSELLADVGNLTDFTAKLEIPIVTNGNNWGTTGRTIDLHRLNVSWIEGNGYINGNPTPNRGNGLGVTWKCAVDSDISNNVKNCSGGNIWDMNNPGSWPFNPVPTDTKNIINHESGAVMFDVTADVKAFLNGTYPNYGWLIKKTDEGVTGKIDFGSKEAGNGARLEIFPPGETEGNW